MLPNSAAADQSPRQHQLALEKIRQRMLELIAAQPEKQVPRITDVKAAGAAGCARWCNI